MGRVLLCDDTKDLLLLLTCEIDLEPDLEVVGTAGNGLEGVEAAARLQPDVVVLDLAMPVMDGFEALPRILGAAPETRVIVLSGFEAAAVEERALELGATRYIEKGEGLGLVVSTLREVLAADPSSEGNGEAFGNGSRAGDGTQP